LQTEVKTERKSEALSKVKQKIDLHRQGFVSFRLCDRWENSLLGKMHGADWGLLFYFAFKLRRRQARAQRVANNARRAVQKKRWAVNGCNGW